MPKGGKREGSGRPIGSGVKFKRAIQDYFTEEEVKELITELKSQMKDDKHLLTYTLDQLFGKAPQRMELTGKDGGAIGIVALVSKLENEK